MRRAQDEERNPHGPLPGLRCSVGLVQALACLERWELVGVGMLWVHGDGGMELE